MQEFNMKSRWTSVSAARAKEKAKNQATSAADVVMNDLGTVTKSAAKIIDNRVKTLQKQHKSLEVSTAGKGSRPRVPGFSLGRFHQGAPSHNKSVPGRNKSIRKSAPVPNPTKNHHQAFGPQTLPVSRFDESKWSASGKETVNPLSLGHYMCSHGSARVAYPCKHFDVRKIHNYLHRFFHTARIENLYGI